MINIQCGAWLTEAYVPQGSALGPLLFLIHVNEIPMQGTLLQYADDTTLICTGTSISEVHQCLTEDLRSLFSWIKEAKYCKI